MPGRRHRAVPDRIDRDAGRRHRHFGAPAREPLGMRLEAVIERSLADLCNLAVSASEDLLWREASQPAVMVLQVYQST